MALLLTTRCLCAGLGVGSHKGGLTSYKYGKQCVLLGFTMYVQYNVNSTCIHIGKETVN